MQPRFETVQLKICGRCGQWQLWHYSSM